MSPKDTWTPSRNYDEFLYFQGIFFKMDVIIHNNKTRIETHITTIKIIRNTLVNCILLLISVGMFLSFGFVSCW